MVAVAVAVAVVMEELLMYEAEATSQLLRASEVNTSSTSPPPPLFLPSTPSRALFCSFIFLHSLLSHTLGACVSVSVTVCLCLCSFVIDRRRVVLLVVVIVIILLVVVAAAVVLAVVAV